jgi:hypothetical protein
MTKLSPQAKSALQVLQEKHLNYTISKSTIEAELKKELHSRLSGVRHERNVALRIAAESGVPKTQLGKAIGTSNYRTVQEILAQTDSNVDLNQFANQPTGISIEAHSENGLYTIMLSNFGENSVNGHAVVSLEGDDGLTPIAGDQFVLPQVYRNGYADYVIEQINKLT